MSAGDEFLTNLTTYTDDTKKAFGAAHANIPDPRVFPTIDHETPDVRGKRAQGTVSAMLQQLGQAAKWESEQAGREGYAAVVAVMKSVAATADAVGQRIKHIVMPSSGSFPTITPAELDVIRVLNETLKGLGALSAADVWVPPSTSNASPK